MNKLFVSIVLITFNEMPLYLPMYNCPTININNIIIIIIETADNHKWHKVFGSIIVNFH